MVCSSSSSQFTPWSYLLIHSFHTRDTGHPLSHVPPPPVTRAILPNVQSLRQKRTTHQENETTSSSVFECRDATWTPFELVAPLLFLPSWPLESSPSQSSYRVLAPTNANHNWKPHVWPSDTWESTPWPLVNRLLSGSFRRVTCYPWYILPFKRNQRFNFTQR